MCNVCSNDIINGQCNIISNENDINVWKVILLVLLMKVMKYY